MISAAVLAALTGATVWIAARVALLVAGDITEARADRPATGMPVRGVDGIWRIR